MALEFGSFSNGSTGNTTLNLIGSFTPTFIEFWAAARFGTTESANLSSIGLVDITNGNAMFQTNFTDSTGAQTKNSSGSATGSSCLQHYARVSGTLTKVLDIKFVSATSGSFVINYLTANSNYQIFCKIHG